MIAIENVRLFNETKEALERQTATAEVLNVISGSPTDVQPVFDIIAERAARLSGADSGCVFRFDGERMHAWPAPSASAPRRARLRSATFPMPPRDGSIAARRDARRRGRATSRRCWPMPDAVYRDQRDRARAAATAACSPCRCCATGRSIGAIAVTRAEPGRSPSKEIELLQTFADQAVIAIENVRLFNETKEALERQTATAEILRSSASSPTDVQPVFDAIVERGVRLLATSSRRVLMRGDGDCYRCDVAGEDGQRRRRADPGRGHRSEANFPSRVVARQGDAAPARLVGRSSCRRTSSAGRMQAKVAARR